MKWWLRSSFAPEEYQQNSWKYSMENGMTVRDGMNYGDEWVSGPILAHHESNGELNYIGSCDAMVV